MMRLLALLLLICTPVAGQQVLEEPGPADRSVFLPDTVLSVPDGPRLILFGAEGARLAALRLSVALSEGPGEAGAGWILREIAQARLESLARPVGARVSVSRTPWGLAYAVEGAAADFEYLVYLLRDATGEPALDPLPFGNARTRLREEVARQVEIPGGRLVADLRSQVAPGQLPPEGTPATVDRLDAEAVRRVWARSHRADAMTLVMSAPVAPEVALAATRGLGLGPDRVPDGTPAAVPSASRPRPESLQTWYGEAYAVGPAGDPRAAVAAVLVGRHLAQRTGRFDVGVELWDLADRGVLAVTGAAFPAQATAMRRAVAGALSGVRDSLDPASLQAAVATVHRDLVARARTQAGLVSIVGRATEASGDPSAAAREAEALEVVDTVALTTFLSELITRGGVRAEVTR